MFIPPWIHGTHLAAHDNSKAGAVGLIVIGGVLAPALIGVPIMLFGIYRLFK